MGPAGLVNADFGNCIGAVRVYFPKSPGVSAAMAACPAIRE